MVVAAFLALLAALLVGCGGGGETSTGAGTDTGTTTSTGEDGSDQDAMRATMLAAADRFDDVPSLDASIAIEASEADSSETVSFCFSLAVINGESAAEEKVALRTYVGKCTGKATSEVLIIGRDVWASQFDGKWSAGRVNPEMVEELTSEDDKYDELLEAATDIRPGPEPRSYEFSAPASAFSQIEEIGDVEVDFVLTIDQRGYLSGMIGTVEEEGSKAVIEQTYKTGNIGPIEAPPAADVVGPVRKITSKEELESLLEPTFEEGFE